MTYDQWKTTDPQDRLPEQPEKNCSACRWPCGATIERHANGETEAMNIEKQALRIAIRKITEEAQKGKYGSVAYRADALVDSARINADDTIYAERAALEDKWDELFKGTLQEQLAYCGDKDVIEWFAKRGWTS